MKRARLNHYFKTAILAVILTSASRAHAGKLDAYLGAFDFSAKTPIGSGSKNGLGSYKIAYMMPVLDNLEVGIGYSLIFSNIVGGDSVYGFDIDAMYFPFTPHGKVKFQAPNSQVTTDTLWRPFVLLSYNARQFQSVSTQYNGFGFGAGTERAYDTRFTLKGMIRYITLSGPNGSTASEITALAGVSFGF